MTGIINELEQLKSVKPNHCSFIDAIRHLDESDRDELMQALKLDYQTIAIQRVLRSRDITISYSTLLRHRRGECLCGNS